MRALVGMVSAGTPPTLRKEGASGGTRGFPRIRFPRTEKKAPGCGSGGFWFLRFWRGDGPKALALRPSHNLRAFRRRLWRAPYIP